MLTFLSFVPKVLSGMICGPHPQFLVIFLLFVSSCSDLSASALSYFILILLLRCQSVF